MGTTMGTFAGVSLHARTKKHEKKLNFSWTALSAPVDTLQFLALPPFLRPPYSQKACLPQACAGQRVLLCFEKSLSMSSDALFPSDNFHRILPPGTISEV